MSLLGEEGRKEISLAMPASMEERNVSFVELDVKDGTWQTQEQSLEDSFEEAVLVRSWVLRSEHMRAEQSSLFLPLRQSRSPHHSRDPKKEITSSKPMCRRKYLRNLRIGKLQYTKCACQNKGGYMAHSLNGGSELSPSWWNSGMLSATSV